MNLCLLSQIEKKTAQSRLYHTNKQTFVCLGKQLLRSAVIGCLSLINKIRLAS